MSKLLKAPWTPRQVEALKEHQAREDRHPYTCICGDHVILTPTPDGWVCPECGHTQDWCHAFATLTKNGACRTCGFVGGNGFLHKDVPEEDKNPDGAIGYAVWCPDCRKENEE